MTSLVRIVLFMFFLLPRLAAAQTGCPSVEALTINGESEVTIDCDEPCVTLHANPFETGSTESYEVSSIPFEPPYPFNLGTPLFIGIDDVYSGVIDLPFDFCFFGINYNQIVVCSNGSVTFNTGSANAYCPWSFTASAPSPNLPANSIFGVYHDIDPSVCGNVRYQILGVEPCRTFVLSYDDVCQFSCTSLQSTSQIVLYETTNTIDVYVGDKPTCSGWNGGRALIGIQNNAGTVAYVPPGRNTGSWSASNEAWRFTPNGGAPTYTVNWYDDGVLIGSGNTLEICPSETSTYTAEAVYDGCGSNTISVDDDITVTVDYVDEEVPSVAITNVTDLCLSEVSYAFLPEEAGGTWSADCGACLSSEGVLDLDAAGAGVYMLTYSQEGPCGPIENSFEVEVYQDPVPGIEAIAVLCTSDAPVLIPFSDPGGTWSADCGDCIDAETGSFDPAMAGAGSHTVSYSFDGPCPVSESIQVEVFLQDVADFAFPATLCENGEAVLPSAEQPGGSWSASCGNCIDGQTGSFHPDIAGAGVHTITHAFESNCPDEFSVEVEVIGVTLPVIEELAVQCNSGGPVVAEANVSGGTWSSDCNCIDPNTGSLDPFGLPAGFYALEYSIDGACPVSASIAFEILQQANPSILDPSVLCTNDGTAMLEATEANGVWSASCGNCINASNGSLDVQMAGPGQHSINYTINGLCGASTQLEINIEQSANASLSEPGTYCEAWGQVLVESLEPGGLFSASCGDCIDAESGVFLTNGLLPGDYEITYTIDGACGDSQSVTLTLVPNDDSSIEADPGYCIDAGGQVLAAAEPGGTWSASCSNCISSVGVFNPFNAGPGIHTVTYSLPGTCGTTSTAELEVYPLPDPLFTPSVSDGCTPLGVSFEQSSEQNAYCLWDFGDGSFSESCSASSHTYTEPNCYDVSLTVTSFDGCTASSILNNAVCAFPLPNSGFTYSPIAPTTDDPYIVLEEGASGEESWEWLANGELVGSAPNLDYNLLDHGGEDVRMCLRVTDSNGCQDTFCRDISLIEKLRVFVPNAFTPDSDGLNEVWMPVVTGAQSYELLVMNRWGELVFESTQPGEPWLGEVKGGDYFAPNGTYVWQLKVVGEDLEAHTFEGFVLLLR